MSRVFIFFLLDLYTIGMTPWTSDRPVARPLHKYRTTQTQNKRTHTHTPNNHALSGIRTHDYSVRASEDSSCLRQLGYRDRPFLFLFENKAPVGFRCNGLVGTKFAVPGLHLYFVRFTVICRYQSDKIRNKRPIMNTQYWKKKPPTTSLASICWIKMKLHL
jgi:hypothetical protein